MSPGNVSYYFPTLEALVAALMDEVHAANEAVAAPPVVPVDFAVLDAMLRAIMRRDLDHRWLVRDTVGLLALMPSLAPRHRQMYRERVARVDAIAERLIEAKLVDARRTRRHLPELRIQLITQVFFWVPSAILAAPDRDPADQLDARARATLLLLRPYCTPLGRRRLDAQLASRPRSVSARRPALRGS